MIHILVIVAAEYALSQSLHAYHCVKSVCIRSYSDPHFPVFGLNMERSSVSLRISPNAGK